MPGSHKGPDKSVAIIRARSKNQHCTHNDNQIKWTTHFCLLFKYLSECTKYGQTTFHGHNSLAEMRIIMQNKDVNSIYGSG